MQEIEFLYDFGSPNAYLVHRVLPGLAERHGARLHYVPILLGGVFKATNNRSPMEAFAGVKGKLAYEMRETERFVRRHGIRYHMNPYFPLNTLALMRGAVFAQGKDWEGAFVDAVFDAIWLHGQKMDEPMVIEDALREADLPAAKIMDAMRSPEVKQGLIANTDAAVARGVFGAPTMFVGDEMFFGKHSLPELEHLLETA
ncbi:2-hydroxychromene-2-carboxylate isomerase [Jhaorihella thermophila]|uniref:2-hydroxychromene-2-carboxylate isomerase n=1 Tax=Jhaorihella thermophila TaxID=488547 RepID=A0A1H5SF97_9RHOB|nr:2-hydroxychromene-2-carboxylate isomerase [Jhaorihella thermophila]SEF49195.1 2-hydroxychromene-2-carboxylate isomerase [Jhaorihella thermophila]